MHLETVQSTVTQRGQTVVPAHIRKAFGLNASSKLQWVVDGGRIHVIPMGDDPIAAFVGMGKRAGWTYSTEEFLADRREERLREAAKDALWLADSKQSAPEK